MNSTTPPVSDERWRISTLPAYKIESYDNMKEKLQKNSIEIEIIRAECETLKGDLEEKDHQLRRARGARNGSKSPNRVALSPRPPRTPPVETSFESHYTNNEPRRQTMGVPSNARTNTNQRAPIQQMDLLQMIYSQATQMEDNIREIDSQKETVQNLELQTEELQMQVFYMSQAKSQQHGESRGFEGTNGESMSGVGGNDWDGNIDCGRVSLEDSPRGGRDFESPYNKINMLEVDQVAGTGDF